MFNNTREHIFYITPDDIEKITLFTFIRCLVLRKDERTEEPMVRKHHI